MAEDLWWYINQQTKGSVNILYISMNNNNDVPSRITIMLDNDEIYCLLVEHSTKKLRISNNSLLVTGSLADAICQQHS